MFTVYSLSFYRNPKQLIICQHKFKYLNARLTGLCYLFIFTYTDINICTHQLAFLNKSYVLKTTNTDQNTLYFSIVSLQGKICANTLAHSFIY